MSAVAKVLSRMSGLLSGEGLMARAARSSALTVAGFGASQLIRLGSNLILTRLLFPEAFGLMALVSVILMGLYQFTDVGVTPSILQSRRGDDPEFLNTAWTIQAMRGVGLWLTACALAWPMARVYDTPELLTILPVAGLTLLFSGLNPTRLDLANRHLRFGRVTAIDIATQVFGVVAAVALALWWGSVWALVVSNILATLTGLLLMNLFLPGPANRFRWEPEAVTELVGFGKWIFLSTLCGFLVAQGDKLLLGKFLTLETFGIYNIGFFLASFPLLLGGMVTRRLLIPIYRELPPRESAANFDKLQRMRIAVTAGLLSLTAILAFAGVWLVGVMYDPRYEMAGAVVVAVTLAQIPQIVVMTYDQAALAAGDSRRFFVLTAARAAALIAGLLTGLWLAGLIGAIAGMALAGLVSYPVVVWLARRMGAWDPMHDAAAFAAGACLALSVLALHWEDVSALALAAP